MPAPEPTINEASALRRCVRDLVALSSLSAYWDRTDPPGIAEGLAEALLRSLDVDFIYVRVKGSVDGSGWEATRTHQGALPACRAREIGRALNGLPTGGPSDPPPIIPNPFGEGEVRLALVPIGYEGDCGIVVAGSPAPAFPSQTDRLLLSVGANQAAMVLHHKRVEEALKEADRRKDEFLATLAHELRNPLAPLRNALQIMKLSDKGQATENVRDMMERQLRQMVRLVDDLLDVSRISQGKIELRKERLTVAAVVESALETSLPLLEAARHELTVTLPPEPLLLDGDLTRLAQVLSNLLNNAAKYTPESGHIWLTVEKASRGGDAPEEAAIRVRDNGTGIPADMLPRVFEMFTQVNRTLGRAQGGLGIGLTLVSRLVEMHGGTVEAFSEGVGQGSTFLVRLPLWKEAGGGRQKESKSHPSSCLLPSLKVLVADDNVDSAQSLALLLQMMGSEVRTVHDGPSALEVASAFVPDVVLLDIGMPGMSGLEVARRMRAMSQMKDAVLVAQTGWGQDEDRRRSEEAGFDVHLVKPVDPSVLLGLLAALPRHKPKAPPPP